MNLKKLAQLLDLSPTTVSRALNGFPEVSESTRIRVQRAAELHNYQPNAKAKGLATGRTNTIGHIIPVSDRHEMVNPIFADFISGASKAYLEARYDMLISLVEDSDEESAYQKIAARGRVDGLIVHGPKVEDARLKLLKGLGLPFVVHGRMINTEGY
ncbi:MAG: LacI family DNA-binding transcriptional regulator, partial [Granulosicoccaceae bacterium]